MLSYRNEELDLLIFFYLQECGYFHSAFTLGHESSINFSEHINCKTPPGLLISLVQRGLLYAEMEMGFPLLYFENFRSPILDFMFQQKKELTTGYNYFEYIRTSNTFILPHQHAIQTCLWHPRRFFIYLGTCNSKIYQWNILTRKIHNKIPKIEYIRNIPNKFNEKSEKNEVNNIDCNLNGTIFVSSDFKGGIFFWAETGKLLKNLCIALSAVNDLKWSQNSRYIAIGYINGKITIFSSWFIQKLIEISVQNFDFLKLKWISNIDILFLSSHNKMSFANIVKKKIYEFFIHSSKTCDVDVYTAQNFISTCSRNGKIRIWIYQTNLKLIYEICAHLKEISVIKWKPKNLRSNFNSNKYNRNVILLSASLDCSIKIWNVQKKKCVFTFTQMKPVISAAWNIFENKLVAGLSGSEIILICCNEKKYSETNLGKHAVFDISSHSMLIAFLFVSSNKIICL
nr:regulator of epidermal growth factor receptor [Cryptomonas sp.]